MFSVFTNNIIRNCVSLVKFWHLKKKCMFNSTSMVSCLALMGLSFWETEGGGYLREDARLVCSMCVWYQDVPAGLKEEGSHAAHFWLLLDEYLEVLVDDGHSQEDSGPGTNCSHEIGRHRQGSDAETTEGCCSWNVPERWRKYSVVAAWSA